MTDVTLKDANDEEFDVPLPKEGRSSAATSRAVALSNEDKAALDAIQAAQEQTSTGVGSLATAVGATNTALGTVVTELGAPDETPAANDTASSGLNGLMKRLLARITTLLGRLPGSLDTKDAANSLAVTLSTEDKGTLTAIKTAAESTASSSVKGGIAHDAAATEAPILVAALGSSTKPTALGASGRVGRLWADLIGRLVVTGLPRSYSGDAWATINNSNSAADLLSAQGGGIYADIVALTFVNETASDMVIQVFDADDTTLRYHVKVPANDSRGIVWGDRTPKRAAAANAKWRWKLGSAVSGNVTAIIDFTKES